MCCSPDQLVLVRESQVQGLSTWPCQKSASIDRALQRYTKAYTNHKPDSKGKQVRVGGGGGGGVVWVPCHLATRALALPADAEWIQCYVGWIALGQRADAMHCISSSTTSQALLFMRYMNSGLLHCMLIWLSNTAQFRKVLIPTIVKDAARPRKLCTQILSQFSPWLQDYVALSLRLVTVALLHEYSRSLKW